LIDRLGRILHWRKSAHSTIEITFWGKADCSLCDKAQAILDRLSLDYPVVVDKRDISADPAAFERYRYVIPVVEIKGGPSFELKISEHRLRSALEELTRRPD
jgi:hypothetical protein